MKRSLCVTALVVFVLVGLVSEAPAQQRSGLPGHDVGSVALHIGAVTPMRDLPDGTSFDSGIAGGLAATAWAFPNFGVRGTVMFGQGGGTPGPGSTSRAGLEEPTLALYSLDLLARYPMVSGQFAWFPYLGGGIGGKQYLWSEQFTGVEWDLAFAWTTSGGVEVRPAASPRLGFVLDVSRFSSKYIWHGFFWEEPKLSDLRVTAGITLNR
jgi:opacity protein-like surface antigen